MNIVRTAVVVMFLLGVAGVFAADPAPSTAPATQPTPPTIQSLNQTADPSAAVEVYAKGMAINPNDVELQQAYVHHMVDLGAPELADAQAHSLLQRKAADPLTIGVAAYMDASRGQTPAAIANLKTAIAQRPDEPFLLRTAAQIVAWYDTSSDRSMLTQDDVAGIETLRLAGKNKPEFDEAYRMAFDARQHARSQASATTAPAMVSPYEAQAASAQAPTYVTLPSSYYYDYTPEPYLVGGPNYYYPYWGYGWWPAPSIIVLRDRQFHHHRFFHDGFHDGLDHRDGFVVRPDGSFPRSGLRQTTPIQRVAPAPLVAPAPRPAPMPMPAPRAAPAPMGERGGGDGGHRR